MICRIFGVFTLLSITIVSTAATFAEPRQAATMTDNWLTEAEYAKKIGEPLTAVKDRFAATGVLRCERGTGSAQLTVNNRTITTAAHVMHRLSGVESLDEAGSCGRLHEDARTCTFSLEGGAYNAKVPVKRALAVGSCLKHLDRRESDWAILELEQPVTKATPYEILSFPDLKRGTPVVAVAAASSRFRNNQLRATKRKSLEDCEIRGTALGYGGRKDAPYFRTNCAISGGSSGGSLIFMHRGKPHLIGLWNTGIDEESLSIAVSVHKEFAASIRKVTAAEAPQRYDLAGILLSLPTPELEKKYSVNADEEALIVDGVQPGSDAEHQGLRPGMEVFRIESQRTSRIEDVILVAEEIRRSKSESFSVLVGSKDRATRRFEIKFR